MKLSAGILLYRIVNNHKEYFLAHPGGPFFKNKNEGSWTVPKGEPQPNEDYLQCAIREFEEETGHRPSPPFTELEPIIQKGGKKVLCWAAQGNLNPETITCNTFNIEWPPKSGNIISFPEIDKTGWYNYDEAIKLINEKQISFIEEAESSL